MACTEVPGTGIEEGNGGAIGGRVYERFALEQDLGVVWIQGGVLKSVDSEWDVGGFRQQVERAGGENEKKNRTKWMRYLH